MLKVKNRDLTIILFDRSSQASRNPLHLSCIFEYLVLYKKVATLKAEHFAARNFRVFLVFWSFSRMFIGLEIINQQNAKVLHSKNSKKRENERDFFFNNQLQ